MEGVLKSAVSCLFSEACDLCVWLSAERKCLDRRLAGTLDARSASGPNCPRKQIFPHGDENFFTLEGTACANAVSQVLENNFSCEI